MPSRVRTKFRHWKSHGKNINMPTSLHVPKHSPECGSGECVHELLYHRKRVEMGTGRRGYIIPGLMMVVDK